MFNTPIILYTKALYRAFLFFFFSSLCRQCSALLSTSCIVIISYSITSRTFLPLPQLSIHLWRPNYDPDSFLSGLVAERSGPIRPIFAGTSARLFVGDGPCLVQESIDARSFVTVVCRTDKISYGYRKQNHLSECGSLHLGATRPLRIRRLHGPKAMWLSITKLIKC